MIDSPAQIVIVDDNKNHLRAIVETFHKEGISCLGLHHTPEHPLNPKYFRGVRVLFLDLHLLPSATLGGEQHFGYLAQLLEECISSEGGPFALLLWTKYDEDFKSLIQYLDNTQELSKHARPIAYGIIAKDKFLRPEEDTVENHAGLIKEIENAIQLAPQLKAIFTWERDVQSAIRSTLASMLDLVSSENRSSELYTAELETLLSRLAIEAVGEKNVSKDPRAALDASLVPILADKISNGRVPQDLELWRSVINESNITSLSPIESASLNRMLHVAIPDPETILGSDWGAVVDLPARLESDQEFRSHFGQTLAEVIENHFKVSRDKHDQCAAKFVRIGAPCDYAQQRSGPISYLLALEVPASESRRKKRPQAVWLSPLLSIDQRKVFRLLVSSVYPFTVLSCQTSSWTANYRLREPLLMELLHEFGTYSTRPGKISFE